MYEGGYPWGKFIILSIPLIILMLYWAPTWKWKILFSLCVPIGVGLALAGRSINFHRKKSEY